MKKKFALLFAGLMTAAVVFSGCGTSFVPSPAATTAPPAPKCEEQVITISYEGGAQETFTTVPKYAVDGTAAHFEAAVLDLGPVDEGVGNFDRVAKGVYDKDAATSPRGTGMLWNGLPWRRSQYDLPLNIKFTVTAVNLTAGC